MNGAGRTTWPGALTLGLAAALLLAAAAAFGLRWRPAGAVGDALQLALALGFILGVPLALGLQQTRLRARSTAPMLWAGRVLAALWLGLVLWSLTLLWG